MAEEQEKPGRPQVQWIEVRNLQKTKTGWKETYYHFIDKEKK